MRGTLGLIVIPSHVTTIHLNPSREKDVCLFFDYVPGKYYRYQHYSREFARSHI